MTEEQLSDAIRKLIDESGLDKEAAISVLELLRYSLLEDE